MGSDIPVYVNLSSMHQEVGYCKQHKTHNTELATALILDESVASHKVKIGSYHSITPENLSIKSLHVHDNPQ